MFDTARIISFLKHPVVDKILGIIGTAPVIVALYFFWESLTHGQIDIYTTLIITNLLFIMVFTFIRRTPKRVSLNPLYWLITFLRNFWGLLATRYLYNYNTQTSEEVKIITYALLACSVLIMVYARVYLGRNLGFVPARRELVTTGPYAVVRHPIHIGQILFFISYILFSPTIPNFILMGIGIVFVASKTWAEDRFWQEDEDYRAYAKKVRWKLIPGLY